MQSSISFKKKVRQNYTNYNDTQNSEWMQSVQAMLDALTERPWNVSIYKVPSKLRSLKEDAYSPQVVSIGPFHQHKHELRAMEEHKWRYMLNFLRRAPPAQIEPGSTQNPTEEMALNKCVQVISDLEGVPRACYAENFNLNKQQLMELLLVDACFLLQLFINQTENEEILSSTHPQLDDPIFNNLWMVSALQHDLALLENQIPFVVLQNLFNAMQDLTNNQFPFSLNKYVLVFFRSALNLTDGEVDIISKSLLNANPNHLLDILHQVYNPRPNIGASKLIRQLEIFPLGFERCATELFKSGVQFQAGPYKGHTNLLDVKFSEGVLTIPPVLINKSSDSIFRNLIALEQFSFGRHHITSYVILMSSLIRSPKDAALIGSGVLNVEYGSGEDNVSTFFNNLGKEVGCKDFYYAELCREVNKYKRFPLQLGRVKAYVKVLSDEWTESLHDLKQTYFRTRWSFISFLAASLVIFLTILQTLYTVRSYYS